MKYELISPTTILVTDDFGASYSVPVDSLNKDFRKYVERAKKDKRLQVPIDKKHFKDQAKEKKE